ncbi:Uncharacterised protein [Legionella beliardensis]|uniref:Uncharacterized protein n=1 Tax=Legionella beliardensis TaxID=91822 RepID=A0A378HX74_9GAMM|nr:hypothetical protein [Legionella beliardensis]STX27507.1 Uncharacterised protein [Legionella beliardensis]
MPLPSKALRYDDLILKSAGEVVPTSGHEVFKVEFFDAAGEKKLGFYKPLSSTYPRILAEYSVATSVFMGTLLDRVAEERLVLNEHDEVIGSVSIAIPNFKPLQQWTEPTPADPHERERVCPSVETLLYDNFAELLLMLLLIGEDDGHPGNVSAMGLIDGDMRLYYVTHIMKGGRLSDLLKDAPEILMRLRGSLFDNFPNSLPATHSPAHTIPSNGNVAKIYKNYAEFQKLAANPSLLTKDGPVSFQDQLFHALLKQLIIFDPQLLRARLEHYFGDRKFDYSCLDEQQRAELKRVHPTFFQPEFEQNETFVDHIMKVFYDRYQQLYRAAVFYPGCPKNDSGVAVVAFNDYLRNKPSAVQQIIAQAEEKNSRMDKAWKYKKETHSASNNSSNNESFIHIEKPSIEIDKFLFDPSARFDPVKIKQRYHQVWRDSLIFLIKDSLSHAKRLAKELVDELRITPIVSSQVEKPVLTTDDAELTKALQLLDSDLDSESISIDCDKNNSLLLGVKDLIKFRDALKSAAFNYYNLEIHELTVEKNQEFCRLVSDAILNYESNIYTHLSGTQWSKKFGELMNKILNFYGNFNFQRHLSSPDSPIETKDKYNYAQLLKIPHTNPEVRSEAIKALFDWVNKLNKDTFNGIISTIIAEYYSPSSLNPLASRHREEPVTQYLKVSKEDNANKLAYILSTGGHSSTSLNTQLIKYLMKLFVSKTIQSYTVGGIEDKTIGAIDVNLSSVEYACEQGKFNENEYTLHAIQYAKTDPRFTHLYSTSSLARFNQWMYKWVAGLVSSDFESIIRQALTQYEPYAWNWFSKKGRGDEVRTVLKNKSLSNAGLLAYIFSRGETNDSSFNSKLFSLLLNRMQMAIAMSSEPEPDAQLVLKVAMAPEHIQYYLKSLADYAKGQSYEERPAITGHTEKTDSLSLAV